MPERPPKCRTTEIACAISELHALPPKLAGEDVVCHGVLLIVYLLVCVFACLSQESPVSEEQAVELRLLTVFVFVCVYVCLSQESPVSEEQAVKLRLFGIRLADVSGVSLELGRDDGSKVERRLQPVPSRYVQLFS